MPSARWTFTRGSRQHRLLQAAGWGLLALAALLVPFLFAEASQLNIGDNKYTIALIEVSKALAFAVAVLGLNVAVGYTGQISLGNSFFVGTGGYLTAVVVADFNWPYLATLVVVIPATFVVGMLVGIPALRIRGLYLALVTLALAAIFPSLVKLDQLIDRTGGSNGLRVPSKLAPPSWLPLDGLAEFLQGLPGVGEFFGDGGLSSRQEEAVWKYLLLVAMAGAAFWMVSNLVDSRPGRAMRAIRDNETGAAVQGVNLAWNKTLAFGVSAALGGVAGTMYAMLFNFVDPETFNINLAIFLIVGLVVGGVGTTWGSLIGGFAIVLIPLWARQTTSVPVVPEQWLAGPTGTLILGALLVVITFVLPGGIVFGLRRVKARIVAVVPVPPGPPDGAQPLGTGSSAGGSVVAAGSVRDGTTPAD